MKILVTGSQGFIGRNLIAHLNQCGYTDILEYDKDANPQALDEYARRCGLVFHLAGINRPQHSNEFIQGNTGFTKTLLEALERHRNKSPVVVTSSIQASLDNPYGQSKLAGEQLVFSHMKKTGSPAFIYRLPNVFGKWCKPNYNSAVATFCYNIAHGLPIAVNNSETIVNLVYIDDVATEFIRVLEGKAHHSGDYCAVQPVYAVMLGQIVTLLESFRDNRDSLEIPNLSDDFTRKLYSTYLSYLPEDGFSYPLKMHIDHRGSFTEFLRTSEHGQVSVNVSKPGITKGNHWHHTKNEKFLVVSGEGIIRFRSIYDKRVIEYTVNGNELRVVDIPPGYTHSIENTGISDMVTIMWVNECFNPQIPDTHILEVL